MPLSNVLVVESTSVRNLIGAVLQKERYDVFLEDVPRAQKLLQTNSARFDLLITNEPWQFEPYLPEMRVLYVSGAPEREFLQRHRCPTFGYLQKPFRFQELLLSVHLLLQARREEPDVTAEPCPSHHP